MKYITIILILLFTIHCGNIDNSKSKDKFNKNLLFAGLVASTTQNSTTINFKSVANTQGEIACNQRVQGQKAISESTNLYLKDLRLYVHNIYLLDALGNKQTFNLTADNKFQSSSIALLDFEDGTGDCSGGTSETNKTLKGTVSGLSFSGIGFTVGVPSSSNFLDSSTASAPLNVNAMYWNWKAGYKFLKFDFATKDGAGTSNSFHLGAGSCNGANSTTSSTSCTYDNLPTIEIKKTDGSLFNLSSDYIALDIYSLLSGTNTNLSSGGSELICMTGNASSNCKTIINNAGIDETTGKNYSTQKAFKIATN